MTKSAIVLLADGCEEIEAITVIDLLRRAQVTVTVVGVTGKEVTASRGTRIVTDMAVETIYTTYDACICPGGMPGAANLAQSTAVAEILKAHHAEGKIIGAICAAPAVVLAPLGLLHGRKATCFPGMEEAFPPEATYTEDAVVVDGNIITSRGPATAFLFALTLVTYLAGKDTMQKIKEATLFSEHHHLHTTTPYRNTSPYIIWNDSYNIGVHLMDAHHRKFIEYINDLYAAITHHAGAEEIVAVFDDFSYYAKHHFTSEERLLKQHNYPELAAQEKAHKTYLDKLEEFGKQLVAGVTSVSVDALVYFRDWFLNHIQHMDRAYGPFIKNKS